LTFGQAVYSVKKVKNTRTPLLLILVLRLTVSGVSQDKPDLITDRPDQTESPYLIPAGALQIESGFSVEREFEPNLTMAHLAFNSTLIRYGINENFELRLLTEYLGESIRTPELTLRRNGFSPLTVGAKLKLANQNGPWPQMGLITHIKLRKGSKEFSNSNTATSIRATFSNTLNGKLTLDYNVGVEWNGETPEAIVLGTASLSYSIHERLVGFLEGYGFFPEKGPGNNRMDTGLMYKLTDMTQLDIFGGIGFGTTSGDFMLGAGASMRFFK
jgi:hypothetical protein